MLLAREEEYQGKLANWKVEMRERKEVEEAFNISFLERTFGGDGGDFWALFREGRWGGGNVVFVMRRCPCGGVLHLKCIQRWLAIGKYCPRCGVRFKLAKVPRPDSAKGKGGQYPLWEDDGYFNFILI